jgi:hypothetical protein
MEGTLYLTTECIGEERGESEEEDDRENEGRNESFRLRKSGTKLKDAEARPSEDLYKHPMLHII